MNYLLDTNSCIYIMKQRPPQVLTRFQQLKHAQIYLSAITAYELYYGAEHSQAPKKSLAFLEKFLQPFPILDFTLNEAQQAAKIRQALNRQGTPIGPYDLQIAATALQHQLILVTNNVAEFNRVKGLKVENWV